LIQSSQLESSEPIPISKTLRKCPVTASIL